MLQAEMSQNGERERDIQIYTDLLLDRKKLKKKGVKGEEETIWQGYYERKTLNCIEYSIGAKNAKLHRIFNRGQGSSLDKSDPNKFSI